MAALIVALAALVVSAAAAAISARHLREAHKANTFPATVDLFREYRSAEMVAARRLLSLRLKTLDSAGGIRGLPDDVAQAALKVSHYLDNLGVQVAYELIDAKVVAGFLGDSTLRLWSELLPFVARERTFRSSGAYLQYFEHLAATLKDIQPTTVRAGLRRWSA